jgi:phage terminase small subunit
MGRELSGLKYGRLLRRLKLAMPWLEPADEPVARAWCELEVLSQRCYADLRDRGLLNAEGEARRLLDDYRKLRNTQLSLASALGMTPAARIAIKAGSRKADFDLAAAMAVEAVANEEKGEG